MGRYDEDNVGYSQNNMRQKDLVLSTNEFVFIQSKTNGQIKTYTGPIMVTISAQESMVVFNEKTKRFEETSDFERARQIFTSAPEGWYVVLKNPAKDGTHPDTAKAMLSPDLNIGKKINVAGPCSFSLYPGQMTRVVQGHRLRSNQYLLARVYDPEAAEKSVSTIYDAEGKEVTKSEKYFAGQLLIIKGTEVSFYMPPTGIEVIPVGGKGGSYIRDAVTLERLEYVILKDESGSKRYVAGPSVVFPEPTETFVEAANKTGGVIFRALELSPISGIYVKVIADYQDDDGTAHKTGEELFITGKDQMIYYPRPEHALIQYDGKYMHHAIAIPEGEGRYVLNRLNGSIKTVKGPAMYLPDPRYEVIAKRKLSRKECELLYPGNVEVLSYNEGLTESAVERLARSGKNIENAVENAYSTANAMDSLAIFEASANISRGVSYTKPRTITLDTKYDGVVSVDVWTGYAINVVSKSGKREVVVGPTTRLLDYDETVEGMYLSTGRPKTTDHLLSTGFLRIDHNKVSDLINVQTSDYVDVSIKVSYCVNFLKQYKDKWFAVENYVKYLTDHMRSLLKKEMKQHTIQDLYAKSADIVRDCILITDKETGKHSSRIFEENGMELYDVEVLSLSIDPEVNEMLEQHQMEMISKTLELSDADARMKVVKALDELEKQEIKLKADTALYKQTLENQKKAEEFKQREEMNEKIRAAELAEQKAKSDMQAVLNAINKAQLARDKAASDAQIEVMKQKSEIKKAEQEAYAKTIVEMFKAIQPDLVAAIQGQTNADLANGIASTVSPYAMAGGKDVSEVVSQLLRGTTLDSVLEKFKQSPQG